MKIKRKNKSNHKISFFLLTSAFFCASFWPFQNVQAESITDISNSDERQEQKDAINAQIETTRQIIEIKEKQSETLADQISLTDLNIGYVQSQIELSTRQISDLNSQIIDLERQIKEKKLLINSQKKMLANMIQTYYETNKSGLITSYLSGENIASFIVKKDRIAQTGDKINELVKSIAETKKDLENQKTELDEKKNVFVSKNQKLQDQNSDLEAVKKQRQTLLVQTQGEEDRYRAILKNLQKQKQELLDIDQFFAASGLSADSYPKPDSKYFASTSWYYAQWDNRWGNENIGNTRTKMKSYGCAVTAVAMVFTQQSVSMTPKKLANEPIFSGDLINWYDSSDWEKKWPTPDSHGYAHGNINWPVIDSKIKNNIPVIIYIKRSKGGGHYVVVHHKVDSGKDKGKYVVHDPYFGANIFLDTSRALVGAMGSSSRTSIDQMIIYN